MLMFILPFLVLQCFLFFHRPLFSSGRWTKAEIAAVDIIVPFITTNADADIIIHTITNTIDTEINAGTGTTIVVMGPAKGSTVLRGTKTIYKADRSIRPYRFSDVD